MSGLFAENTPARFWRLLPDPGPEAWAEAVAAALSVLPPAVREGHAAGRDLFDLVLGEEQFGPGHWRLGLARRAYYELKPLLPARLMRRIRRVQARRAARRSSLGWPVEDRFVRFQAEAVRRLLATLGRRHSACIDLWPGGARFAFVLTHDVESAAGLRFVPEVAALEQALGFRSSFNLVAGLYRIDRGLVSDLVERGFEIGVHGYRHDGKLFSSHAEFSRRAGLINQALRELGAVGFRAPLMHRNPEWLQELEVEYDLSFFDTDPYEPVPGGTMTVWPFQLGRFVELPYTLAQDSTLWRILGERSPRIWERKLAFIAASRGMALLNTHPDYLRERGALDVYGEFLAAVAAGADHWRALPAEVAAWWRARAAAPSVEALPGAVAGCVDADDPFSTPSPVPDRAA